jgi:hypothetical protein
MMLVMITITGKEARITNEKLQPLEKAKVRPASVIEKARMIVAIFSPRALYMAWISLTSLDESSEGLVVSNHALSYLRIASRYFTLSFLATRSLNIRRKVYEM